VLSIAGQGPAPALVFVANQAPTVVGPGRLRQARAISIMSARSINLGALSLILLVGAFFGARAARQEYLKYQFGWAQFDGDTGRMTELLREGLSVHTRGAGGETLLMMAASTDDIALVKAALRRGADVNETDKEGQTALMRAVAMGQVRTTQALLQAGASLDIKDHQSRTVMELVPSKTRLKPGATYLERGVITQYGSWGWTHRHSVRFTSGN